MPGGGGSSQTSSQTTSSGPWNMAKPYLKDAMGQASNLMDNKKGFNAYPGGSYVGMSGPTQGALNTMQGLASQANPFYQPAADFTGGLIGGQYNHDLSGYQAMQSQGPSALQDNASIIATGQKRQKAVDRYGRQIASGDLGLNTEGDYRNMLGNTNTEFENTVNNAANDMGDQIQRQFGGASYGSASNADYLTKGVGDLVSKMRSDNFYNNQNLQRGLLGDITGVQNQNIGNRLQATGMLSNEQGQNISRMLQASGMLSGEQQANFSNQRGLLNDMSSLQQQDIQNRMGGVGMADQVYQSQYLPAERMAQVGAAYDQDAAAKRQSDMDTYNINQQAPWNRLAQAFGIYSGSGAQGNTVQSSVSQPQDIWSKLLGGGLLGSQLIGGGMFG